MGEKTNPSLFEEQLKSLTGIVFPLKGNKGKEQSAGYGTNATIHSRLCECCGSSAFGYRTFNATYAPNLVPKNESATWDLKDIIVFGSVGKSHLPTLPTGRHFMRLKGDKNDFLITWGA